MDETLEAMKEDQGKMADDCAESENLEGIWDESGPVDATSLPLKCLQVRVEGPEEDVLPYYQVGI